MISSLATCGVDVHQQREKERKGEFERQDFLSRTVILVWMRRKEKEEEDEGGKKKKEEQETKWFLKQARSFTLQLNYCYL